MPLVLSLREGADFFVDGTRIIVKTIREPSDFDLVVDGKPGVKTITDREAVEVLPDVFVSAGPRPRPHSVRLVIDAPLEISILRGGAQYVARGGRYG
jgi:hypothetical protein